MTESGYKPLAGTIPARAVAFLNELPDGEMVSSSVLAAEVDCDPSDLRQSLRTAVNHGAISHEQRDGLNWWGKGDGKAKKAARQLSIVAHHAARGDVHAGGFRCAIWSDGQLVIQRDGEPTLTFSEAETQALVGYLTRRVGEAA